MDVKNIKPAYQFNEPNEPVVLDEGLLRVKIEGTEYEGIGRVVVNLLPIPSVSITADLPSVPDAASLMMALIVDAKKVEWIKFKDNIIDGYLSPNSWHENASGISVKVHCKNCTVVSDMKIPQLSKLVFHLFNYDEILDTKHFCINQTENYVNRINFIKIEYKNWIVIVKQLAGTRDITEKLRAIGGFGVTHVGEVQKKDRSVFTVDEVENLLSALGLLLSFSKGADVYPDLLVGFDNGGGVVWQKWCLTMMPYKSCRTCFGHKLAEQIEVVFPLFYERWQDDDWKQMLQTAINWYCRANNNYPYTDLDSNFILAQTAVEKIAYFYSVRYKKLISKTGFDKLMASDMLRLLFSSLGIPIDIPVSCPKMKDLVNNKLVKWSDAPHALTDIRNSIVHYDNKLKGKMTGRVHSEALKLYLWFIEMSLLACLEYDGFYCSRFSKYVGGDMPVPWRKTT